MQTPLGVTKMPMVVQDIYEQSEINATRRAMRALKQSRQLVAMLHAPGGTPEQLLVGLEQSAQQQHRHVVLLVSQQAAEVAGASAAQHAQVPVCLSVCLFVCLSVCLSV